MEHVISLEFFFFESCKKCLTSYFIFFFLLFFFPSVSIDHIFDNLESGKRIYHFVKRLEKVLTLGSEI